MTTSGTRSAGRTEWPRQIIMVALTVVTLYPLLWLVGSSLKPMGEIFTSASPIPSTVVWSNYVDG